MAALNKVMLIANLTRDPQLKFTPTNTAICEFGVAVTRKFKVKDEQREDTAFVDCTMFGRSAETFAQYVRKGHPVYLEGRLKLDQWEDKNGGGKRSKLSVVVEEFQFLQRRDGNGDETSQVEPPRRQLGQRPKPPQGPPEAPYSEDDQFFDEESVPF